MTSFSLEHILPGNYSLSHPLELSFLLSLLCIWSTPGTCICLTISSQLNGFKCHQYISDLHILSLVRIFLPDFKTLSTLPNCTWMLHTISCFTCSKQNPWLVPPHVVGGCSIILIAQAQTFGIIVDSLSHPHEICQQIPFALLGKCIPNWTIFYYLPCCFPDLMTIISPPGWLW